MLVKSRLFILLLSISIPICCFAEKILYLPSDETAAEIKVDKALEEYRRGNFKDTDGQNYFENHKEGKWFAIDIDQLSEPGEYVLQFEYSYLEQVDLYQIRDAQIIGSWSSGTHVAEADEPANYLTPVFPLRFEKGKTLLLFKVSGTEIFIPLSIQNEADFVRNITHTTALMSVLYGILICFILVNIYFLMFSRETRKSTLFFMLFLLFELSYQSARSGFLNTFLWPDNVFMIERFYLAALAFANFLSIPLLNSFLHLEKRYKYAKQAVWILSATSVIYTPIFLLVSDNVLQYVIFYGRYHQLFLIMIQLVLPAVFFKQADTAGKIFSAGWMLGMVFFITATLKAKGVLPFENFNYHTVAGSLCVSVANLIASGVRLRKITEEKRINEQKLKAAGYQLMQNRSRPHFLMNTFSLLSGLVNSKSEEAGTVIDLMTEDFNFYTNKAMKPLVSISEEMDFIENYLKILRIRFNNKLIYTIDQSITDAELLIPPFSLQPLVENAVKHASLTPEGNREVSIAINSGRSSLCFAVENPVDLEEAAFMGTTHKNIKSRMEYYFKRVIMEISSGQKKYSIRLEAEL